MSWFYQYEKLYIVHVVHIHMSLNNFSEIKFVCDLLIIFLSIFPAMMIKQVIFPITCILIFQTKTVITIFFYTKYSIFSYEGKCACVFIKKQIPFYFVKKIKILEFETFFYSFQFHLNNEKVDNYTCICNLKWQNLQMHAYALVPTVSYLIYRLE